MIIRFMLAKRNRIASVFERKLKSTKINGFNLSSFQVSKNYMKRIYGYARGETLTFELINKNDKFKYTNKLFEIQINLLYNGKNILFKLT